jgi:hypothetical protein
MVAIIDSLESAKIVLVGAKQLKASRASIMTTLTASCFLVATAGAGDFAAAEKTPGGTASTPEGAGGCTYVFK